MGNRVKVLHFANPINRNDFVDSVVRFLDPEKYEVSVCTFNKQTNIAAPDYEKEGIKHFVLNIGGRREYVRAIRRLLKIIKTEKIAILHTHLFDEAFLGSLVARLAPGLKFVLGRHYSDEIYLTSSGLQKQKSLFIEGIANFRADAIIAASSFIQNLLIRQGVNPNKIHRVNYGFEFNAGKYQLMPEEEKEITRKEFGISKSTFVVSNVGRHYFLKGQSYLLEGFAKFIQHHKDSKLLMVGDGPLHGQLKQHARDLGIEQDVIFTGWRKDGHKIIAASDTIVQPTFTEAFPQIMVEAMAQAKPLVITNVSGPCDQVKHQETGFIIPVKDSRAIYEVLCRIQANPEEAESVGTNARNYVISNLNMSSVIKDYERVYDWVLNK